MRRILGYLLLIISGFIAYQSYLNAQPDAITEGMAREAACAGKEGCKLSGDLPNVMKTDVTSRTYQWATSAGPVVVTCKREYVWFGEWSCAGAGGEILR